MCVWQCVLQFCSFFFKQIRRERRLWWWQLLTLFTTVLMGGLGSSLGKIICMVHIIKLRTSLLSTNLRSASRASLFFFFCKDVLLKVVEQVAFKDPCVMISRALADGGVWFQCRDVYCTAHCRQRVLEPLSAIVQWRLGYYQFLYYQQAQSRLLLKLVHKRLAVFIPGDSNCAFINPILYLYLPNSQCCIYSDDDNTSVDYDV